MANKISVNWAGDMAFEAEVNNHKIMLDASENVGGKDRGPRPKPLLLVALAGCTGMDVVSILKKMRVKPDAFRMEADADMTEEHPKIYKNIRLTYFFKGTDLPMDKLQKAVELSQENYCGVSAMLKKASDFTYKIVIEE
ncbi:MAG: OsmC family protein [Bacteroidales bacterium]|nr:OsmC family protein [Bacteroidales bacterium]